MHHDCLHCRYVPSGGLQAFAMVTETLGGRSHHHHIVSCEDCGSFWFDDIVIGGLGIPVPSRRDTVMCDCPEDGRAIYTPTIAVIPVAEPDCHCTAGFIESHGKVSFRAGDR